MDSITSYGIYEFFVTLRKPAPGTIIETEISAKEKICADLIEAFDEQRLIRFPKALLFSEP
jgi:hypothetical protein